MIYLLKDGKLELDDVYMLASKAALDTMTAEEAADINHILKTEQFGGLTIDLNEIFKNILPEDY